MQPVERQKVRRVNLSQKVAYPFLYVFAPLLRWFDIDDFPAGPFMIVCAIVGGLASYFAGESLLFLRHRDDPFILLAFTLVGIGAGIGFAIKLINWLADNSSD